MIDSFKLAEILVAMFASAIFLSLFIFSKPKKKKEEKKKHSS